MTNVDDADVDNAFRCDGNVVAWGVEGDVGLDRTSAVLTPALRLGAYRGGGRVLSFRAAETMDLNVEGVDDGEA